MSGTTRSKTVGVDGKATVGNDGEGDELSVAGEGGGDRVVSTDGEWTDGLTLFEFNWLQRTVPVTKIANMEIARMITKICFRRPHRL